MSLNLPSSPALRGLPAKRELDLAAPSSQTPPASTIRNRDQPRQGSIQEDLTRSFNFVAARMYYHYVSLVELHGAAERSCTVTRFRARE